MLVSIDGAKNKVVAQTKLSAYALQCRGLAVNQVSDQIYVSCQAQKDFASFFIVDGSNDNILNTFVDNGLPEGAAFDPSNGLIYLTHENGFVLGLMSS